MVTFLEFKLFRKGNDMEIRFNRAYLEQRLVEKSQALALMLVLTRKGGSAGGEEIVIGDNREIRIANSEIKGDKVIVAVNAPRDFPVFRIRQSTGRIEIERGEEDPDKPKKMRWDIDKLEAEQRKPLAILTIVSIRGDKVRYGTKAPENVTVHRSEVADRIDAQQAAEAESGDVELNGTKPQAEIKREGGWLAFTRRVGEEFAIWPSSPDLLLAK